MIRHADPVVKDVFQHAKRLDNSGNRLLDEEEIDSLRPLVGLAKAGVRQAVSVVFSLGEQIRKVVHARSRRRHELVGHVVRRAVEVAANEHGRGVVALAPVAGVLQEVLGAVLAGLYVLVVKVRAHDDDFCAGDLVGELAHDDDSPVAGAPAVRGLLGSLAQPTRLGALEAPDVGAVKDWRELALFLAVITTLADGGPRGAQTGPDIFELIVQDFLETEKGVFMAGCDEIELIDQLGSSHVPRLLASDRA